MWWELDPGEEAQMTPQADEAVRQSQVLAGYTVYVDLLRERYPDKEVLTTAMTQEEKRCRLAFECCAGGRSTAMVCSGDAGVYGMAGVDFRAGPGVSGGGGAGDSRRDGCPAPEPPCWARR